MGEEFELLFTSPLGSAETRRKTGISTAITEIGRIIPGRRIRWLRESGGGESPVSGTFVHLA